jgi:hypothetical protein
MIGRLLRLIWLLLTLGVLVLLGQAFGLIDLPGVRGVTGSLPFDLGFLVAGPQATPTPSPVPASPAATPAPANSSGVVAETCQPAAPSFVHGPAALKASLGSPMGEPLECEHVVDSAGNTEQRTTTGLAYYRAATNTVAFTNGVEHWALTSTGLVHWVGPELEPPRNAAP